MHVSVFLREIKDKSASSFRSGKSLALAKLGIEVYISSSISCTDSKASSSPLLSSTLSDYLVRRDNSTSLMYLCLVLANFSVLYGFLLYPFILTAHHLVSLRIIFRNGIIMSTSKSVLFHHVYNRDQHHYLPNVRRCSLHTQCIEREVRKYAYLND